MPSNLALRRSASLTGLRTALPDSPARRAAEEFPPLLPGLYPPPVPVCQAPAPRLPKLPVVRPERQAQRAVLRELGVGGKTWRRAKEAERAFRALDAAFRDLSLGDPSRSAALQRLVPAVTGGPARAWRAAPGGLLEPTPVRSGHAASQIWLGREPLDASRITLDSGGQPLAYIACASPKGRLETHLRMLWQEGACTVVSLVSAP
ncbi:MAG TPA: hypothetical protein VFH51_08105, partial [Myxococcota bacterium]|nr:hypothetical protein [Myxococcota bacterium]